MSPKILIRKSAQTLLAALPRPIHRYLLSCYFNLPKLSRGSGYQVLESLFMAQADSLSTSNAFVEKNEIFRKIINGSVEPVFLDIGANIGQTSCAYASLIPQARIHAFEPFRENFEQTMENTKSFPQIHPHHLAMSNRIGQMEVRRDHHPLSQWNSISSSYQDTLAERGKFTMECIELMTGDTFLARNGIDSITLLKIDTEGHELEVLEGFAETFARNRVHSVLIEVGFGADDIHGQFQAVNEFLTKREMILCGFYDSDFTDDASTNYSNAIYCHRLHFNAVPA